jgi:hypothetical protein
MQAITCAVFPPEMLGTAAEPKSRTQNETPPLIADDTLQAGRCPAPSPTKLPQPENLPTPWSTSRVNSREI